MGLEKRGAWHRLVIETGERESSVAEEEERRSESGRSAEDRGEACVWQCLVDQLETVGGETRCVSGQ